MNAPVKINSYPLPNGDAGKLGFSARALGNLDALIRQHIAEGRYPGAQIALARHGQLALFRSYGRMSAETSGADVTDRTLF
jgi:CubicO group peptidase (beta-lactamase class C family)